MSDLTAQPLGPPSGFNWVFLVDLLVCGVLALFFLFYFNRLFATIVSYAIRAWTWHKYRAYIDISALQISLLGGRLFFKSIRYHGHNETVLVHDGHLTWRYWLRSVQEAEIFQDLEEQNKRKARVDSEEESDSGSSEKSKPRGRSHSAGHAEAGGKQKKEQPCRISIKVSGVEAFLYNRSPAYDSIVEATVGKAKESSKTAASDTTYNGQPRSSGSDSKDEKANQAEIRKLDRLDTQATDVSRAGYEAPQIPSWLHTLPVKIECKRAGVVLGNENTTSVITAKVENSVGKVDAGSASALDSFKLLFNFEFKKVNVTMKPNRDFKTLQLDADQRALRERELTQRPETPAGFRLVKAGKRRWRRFISFFNWRRSSGGSIRTASMNSEVRNHGDLATQDPIPGQGQWHGLMRYLEDNEASSNDEWQDVEYAKSSTLVDCEQIDMRFYWDIPGKVPPHLSEKERSFEVVQDDDMNGSPPPDYGLDFALHGGFIVYGPWADRQRVTLQNVFIPASYVDAVPSQPLRPGETRVCSLFKIFISIEKDVTLRIPTREPSKDEKWQGRSNKNKGGVGPHSEEEKGKHGKKARHGKRRKDKQNTAADARPYGWLDITVKADSTVNYVMDMFARKTGYRNTLDLDVKGTEIMSSVNHGLLWRAGPLTLEADLSYPVGWSSLKRWPFKMVCDDIELFILRDHMFLITDLISDWSSGPPPEFYTFVPFWYDLDITFRNWVMYLNSNDSNIINDPAEFEKNEFLTLEGTNLHAVLGIPLDKFRPKQNEISFDVLSQGMSMRLLNSPRNTLKTLLPDKQVAELPKLTLNGFFCANQETGAGLVDVLRMDLVGTGLALKGYGFLVRHLINVKENYFGDYVHFKTLEEFQNSGDNLEEANEKTASLPKPQTANELDVVLCITADDASVMFPTNLYMAEKFVKAELAHMALDLRIASYYMDMAINFSPVSILQGTTSQQADSPETTASNTQLYIHHVDLDGHRAFGLPPNEPAYLSTWYVDVGAITGECQSSFVHDLALAANAFMFSFPDGENALPIESPNIFYEATFLQLRTDAIRVWLHVDNDALLISTKPVSVDFNDWADQTFSQRVNVRVPDLTIACVDAKSAARHRTREQRRRPVRTYAFFQTSIVLDVVGRKLHFEEELRKQQAYLRNNDQRTHRVPFLQRKIPRPRRDSFENVAEEDILPPAMPYPSFPAPVDEKGFQRQKPTSIKSVQTITSETRLRSKASSSSLSASIRNANANALGVARLPSFAASQHSQQSNSSAASNDYRAQRPNMVPGDRERSKLVLPPSTMAFSSAFAEPYFPLDLVEPDESNVPGFFSTGESEVEESLRDPELSENPDVDPQFSHTTIMIKILPGVRAYVEPEIAVVAANMLRILQPRKPEDVMDAFQSSVMMSIVGHQKERHGKGEILEVKVDLPSVDLRVCAPRDNEQPADTVNISIKALHFMMRQRKSPATEGRQQALAVHATLAKLRASLDEGLQMLNEPAVLLNLEDLTAWVALASSNKIHASVRDVTLGVASSQASYMTGIAQRVAALVQELQTSFDKPLEAAHKRLQLLIHTLTQHGEHIGDPPFMSRMTYLLRAFQDHYRNQESWKVLMRFRHTLQCMPKDVLAAVDQELRSDDISCPSDTPHRILESWAHWRAWDVPNIGRTCAFKALFGESERPVQKSHAKPTAVTWDTRLLKIAVDEGESSSQIVVGDVSLGLDIIPPVPPTGLMLVDENKRTKTQLQIHTSSIGFQFHWNLVKIAGTLVPEVLRIVARMDPEPQIASQTQVSDDGLNRHDYNVVLSTDVGSVALQAINLRHLSQAEGLRMSLVGTTQANDRYGECTSAIISADSTITELHSQTSCIWQTLLTAPNIYIDHLQPTDEAEVPPTVTLSMGHDELQIDVKEQIPGILQLVDRVVTEEVAEVQKLVATIQANMPMPPSDDVSTVEKAEAQPVKINAALLGRKFIANISLLQALSYRLEVKSASMRLAPGFSAHHASGLDFHVGQQNHSFINHSDRDDHQQGLLEIPPINGHVGLLLKPSETNVSVATTISRVEIDAGAIQGMASVLSKTEVQDVMVAAKHGFGDIQHHVAEIFPKKPPEEVSTQPSSDKLLAYNVRLSLLGVRVSAVTPHMAASSTAQLELGIGPLHVKASNQTSIAAGQASLFPEVKAKIQDVGASLNIMEKKRRRQVGNSTLAILLGLNLQKDSEGEPFRELTVRIPGVETNIYPETAAIVVDVINHMQDRIKDLDLSREKEYLRRLRANKKFSMLKRIGGKNKGGQSTDPSFSASDLSSLRIGLDITDIQVSWVIDPSYASGAKHSVQDLVLTLAKVDFSTRGGSEARLTILDLQLQLVGKNHSKLVRTLNSALLPEIGFSVAYFSQDKDRSLAFKASGKPLDVRLESSFIVPVSGVQRSIEYAVDRFKRGTANWQSIPTSSGAPRAKLLGDSHFASLRVEADFAGAQLYMQGVGKASASPPDSVLSQQQQGTQHGRYGQFSPDGGILHTSLKAPGIALKLEYNDTGSRPTVNGELRVDASSNLLLPNVVPLALEVSKSVKEVMQSQEEKTPATPRPRADSKPAQSFFQDESIVKADPTAIFGKTKVNMGMRICKQEFALTCQPIAKVDAKAELEDLYFTVNTIDSEDHGHFFAMSAVLTKLNAQVKHVYSREPTFSFDMDSIILSLMNSRHFSGVNGISAILKINPTRTSINARQLQDLLLFREIWLPPEIRDAQQTTAQTQSSQSNDYMVQRYQTVAAAAAFPWNATVSIAELAVDLDLGQSIGKSSFTISNLWASSQKTSNWEQNLCVGLDEMAVNSHGRMSGFIQLSKLGLRTSIRWPEETQNERKTPWIQASIGFGRLRAKAAFDYQAFAFGDIAGFVFLMYNVRNPRAGDRDRLVAVLDCAKAYIFCTSTSPAQAFGLYQAFERLIHEKQSAFQQSLKEVEKHLRRESKSIPTDLSSQLPASVSKFMRGEQRSPISLHTDVIVTLGAISVGAFPGTFFDSQILKLEAQNIQARFAVGLSNGKVHSGLGMTLGQLQVALASVKRVTVPKTLGDISVDEVISSATNAKGGTILRVPKVVAFMRTWHKPETNNIEYIFKSLFEGKVDVGWNLSRINFIKGMYLAHTRALASRLGKPLPKSSVKITAGPQSQGAPSEGLEKDSARPPNAQEQQKITAEVNLPQSKYEYFALEPPIIETPQLRDMGEATPPLEWIGLHRERLPNVTHQIIIVSLLELAKEVEDAYSRILGES